MESLVGKKIKWNGKEYQVIGYAAAGEKVFLIWLVGGTRLKGDQLKDVKF